MFTSARKASVPSEPTMRWAIMSNGSSKRTNGRMLRPVTFLMAYLWFMRSHSFPLARTLSRSCSMRFMKSGLAFMNSLRLVSSPVSSTVPSASIILAEFSILSLLACVPQFMPDALFITMPPTMALFTEAGSAPSLRP